MPGRNASALLIITLGVLSIAFAPAVNGEPAPAPPDRSLAAALATARPPDTGVAISVDAERVQLPEGAKPIAPGLPIGTIADAYGRLVRPFGSVQAVAPPTMTILNTNPAQPNLYEDMPPSDVLRLLALSLNPAQWAQLTGQQGLGIADLDDRQRLMFEALFPGGALNIAPLSAMDSNHVQTISADRLLQSRLRLSQKVQMMLPVVGKDTDIGPSMPPKRGDPPEYEVLSSEPRTLAGISMKAEVPNVPKRSNIDYNARIFRTAISLKGLKTIGDLVTRIGRQTHAELYADARLENLPLTIVGGDSAAPVDLLPAVAFCVTGTFREVGPAFVLTDDLVGLGTRRMILEAFFDSVNRQRQELVGPIDSLARAHPLADVPLSDNSLALTPAEWKQAAAGSKILSNAGLAIQLPFEQLTSEQQTAAQAMLDHWEAEQQAGEKNGYFAAHPDREQHLTLDGKIMLDTTPLLQLRVPGLDGVVNMEGRMDVSNLFMTLPARVHRSVSNVATSQPPPLDILKRYARRAVMVQPRTLQELDQIFAAMPAADLNEIWLVVPNPGEVDPGGKSAPSTPGAAELVDEALKKAGPAHIRVLPALSLFYWGAAAPTADLDYTIRGETSAQHSKRVAMEDERLNHGITDPFVDRREMVSPFAPSVEMALDSLLKAVIRPGIAGMDWHVVSVPGYEPPEDVSGDGSSDLFPRTGQSDFGYTVEGRLRFLRERHTDPIDIGSAYYADIDLSLPFFDDPERTQMLLAAWDQLRASVDLDLVQRLDATAQRLAAANTPAPFMGLPILMPIMGADEDASWDEERRLPSMTITVESGSPEDIAARTRKSSRIVFGEVDSFYIKDPGRLTSQLLDSPGARQWDGVMFDLTPTFARPGAPSQSSVDLLTRLIAALHPEQRAAP